MVSNCSHTSFYYALAFFSICFNGIVYPVAGQANSQANEPINSEYYEILWESPVILTDYGDEYLGVLDFNGDGLDDVLLGGNHPDPEKRTPVFLLISNGDGTLTDRTEEFIEGELALALPRSAIGDFNSDGLNDIAAFDFGNGKLPGGGTFEPGTPYLLLSNSEGKWVVSDNIEEAERLVNPFLDSGDIHVKSATAGDIDNDGDIDLYVESGGGTNTINPHFIINQGAGEFAVDNSERRMNSGFFCNPGSCWRYATHRLYDLNNDNFLDLVMGQLRRRNNEQQELYNRVVWNDGTGRFKRTARYFEYIDDAGTDLSSTGEEIALIADLDKNGLDEVIVGGATAQSAIRIFSSNRDGSFQEKTEDLLVAPVTLNKPVGEAADLDGDDDTDIILFPKNGGVPVLLINDNGLYSAKSSFVETLESDVSGTVLNMYVEYLTQGDIDRDGDIDLFVQSSGQDGDLPPHFLINDGDANFTVDHEESRMPADIVLGPNRSWLFGSPILSDVNNDEYPDLILGQFRSFFSFQDDLTSFVLLNDGNGRFKEIDAISLPYPSWNEGRTNVKASTTCDLNNDSFADLLFAHDRGFDEDGGNNNSGIFFQVLINQNGEGFEDQTIAYFNDQTRTASTGANNAPYKVYCRDINSDGLSDIVTGGSRSAIGSINPVFFLRQTDNTYQAFDSSLLASSSSNIGRFAYPLKLNEDDMIDLISIDPFQNTVPSLLVSWIQNVKIGVELEDPFSIFHMLTGTQGTLQSNLLPPGIRIMMGIQI